MIDTQQPFNIANITIYPKTDEMSCDGTTIEIKSMAMKMICFFASHHDEIITRDNLRANIWQNSNATDHTINNHMYSLRQIFAKFDDKTKFFHTVTGGKSGYRLLAKVTQEITDTTHTDDKASPDNDNTNHSSYKNTGWQYSFVIEKLANLSYQMKLLLLVSVVFISLLSLRFYTAAEVSYDNLSSLSAMPGREQNPSISEDGTIMLYANRSSRESTWELYASRLSSTSEVLETKKVFSSNSRNENYVSISPNKKQIAFIRYPKEQRGIYLADFNENTLSASNEKLLIPLKTMNLSPIISWLNDSQFFYSATESKSAPRKIYKYDLATNLYEPISAPPLNIYGDFAGVVSPNKHWLAIMRSDESYGYQLFLYDLNKKVLLPTKITNKKDRLKVSFSDDSQSIYFINEEGYLSSYLIDEAKERVISSVVNPGYWPLKIPKQDKFILQQDWGLSSLTNRIIQINNPKVGGDGKREVVVDNDLSIRSITEIGNDGLIFASIAANQKVELWKYQNGKPIKLEAFNTIAHQHSFLSLHWLKGSNKALLSINNTCYIININTGIDNPLCPAKEALYAGRFSKDGQSIYLVGDYQDTSRAITMGVPGYPLSPSPKINNINSIHEGDQGDFYYSHEPSFDIYHFNSVTGQSKRLIERTFVIESFSNNDFIVRKTGIYFMDRNKIRNNAIYFYDFSSKKVSYVVASKDNYPHVVISEDEQHIFLIESYDNNSKLLLISAND